jgi:hypothetical protein
LSAAANNPSGGAGEGIGMGMGFVMAHNLGQNLAQTNSQASNATMPPAIPGDTSYFVAINGQQQGPLNQAELIQKINAGQVNRETLVWSRELVEWTAAEKVAPLTNAFAQTPPPLPKA